MKKTFGYLAIMGLLLSMFTGALILGNLFVPTLGPEATVPVDLADKAYPLWGLDHDGSGVYSITLRNPNHQNDLALVLSAMRPFVLTINGEVCYSYTNDTGYSRVHPIRLPAEPETLEIRLESPSRQPWLKALLTTGARSDWYLNLALVVGCISVGIHLAILFTCLTLYLQKRSETYLLAQCAAALITFISALLTTGIGGLPVGDGLYVAIQHVVDSARMPTWASVLLLLVPLDEAPFFRRLRTCILPAALCAFLVNLIADTLRILWLRELLTNSLLVFGAVILARAVVRKIPWMRLLSLCYLFYFGLNIYNTLTNKGVLPNTELLVYLYTPQISGLLLLFACLFVVNHRFAGKFRQVDELVLQLGEANATLDARVSERTAQLQEQQEQRRSMMVNIFHDLRSPIFSARGCADMMTAHDEGDEECLSVIKDKLNFLESLTEQLFLMAKLEDGKITFAQNEVPLLALCCQLAEESALDAERQGVSFSFNGEEALTSTGDAFRLKQALENLLENARKFTPSGGKITFSLAREGEHALLQVRDTGKGILPQDLPYVFERYYRGKNTDKQRSTGLGLSIAREIVKAHGGQLDVESVPGKGTCFSIRLPLIHTYYIGNLSKSQGGV